MKVHPTTPLPPPRLLPAPRFRTLRFRVLPFFLAILLLASSLDAVEGDFTGPQDLDCRRTPTGVLSLDVDGDGRLDTVVGSVEPGGIRTVAVRLNLGRGNLGEAIELSVPIDPIRFEAAHLDGDGQIDLIFSSSQFDTLDTVGILRNRGSGEFEFFGPFRADRQSAGLASGDFNEDGLNDIVIANRGNFTFSLLLNGGNFDFSNSQTFATGEAPIDVVTADFDEDGHLDLAFSLSTDGQVNVHFGDGAGGFSLFPASYSVGSFPEDLAVADLDEDDNLDLVVAIGGIQEPQTLAILLGDGNGAFSPAIDVPAGVRPRTVSVTDLDADGHQDVVAGLEKGLAIFHGDGLGGLVLVQTTEFEGYLASTTVGDLDEDDRPDVLLTIGPEFHDNRGQLILFPGNSIGLVDSRPSVEVGMGPRGVRAADFNQDGNEDFVVLNSFQDTYSVFLGNGNGSFQAPRTAAWPGGLAENLGLGDFDEDGELDLATVDVSLGQVIILYGDGAGDFSNPRFVGVDERPHQILITDLNHDDHLDLVTGHQFSNRATIRLGDGNGGFSTPNYVSVQIAAWNVGAGDFDEDGNQDLAVVDSHEDRVSIFLGDGTGSFPSSPHASLVASNFPTAVRAADLDRDSHLDLVVPAKVGNTSDLIVYLGNGDGSFQNGRYREIGLDPTDARVADFDEDGFLDVAISHLQGDFTSVLYGDGTGDFRKATRFAIDDLPASFDVGDFDNDDHLDLVVTDGRYRKATLLLNDTFDPLRTLRGNVNATGGALTDVLLINGKIGDGVSRRLNLTPDDPLRVELLTSPSETEAPFVLYAWSGSPDESTGVQIPGGVGIFSMAPPFLGGDPLRIANTLGHQSRLGFERWPGPPTSPSRRVLLDANRIGTAATFTLQGLIVDSAAEASSLAVTNGIVVVSE